MGYNFTKASDLAQFNLGIDLRSSIGGARGRFLRQTNQQRLSWYGGILLNREEVDGENAEPSADLREGSVEAIGAMQAEWFRYDEPQLDIMSSLVVYPSLSESGRARPAFVDNHCCRDRNDAT